MGGQDDAQPESRANEGPDVGDEVEQAREEADQETLGNVISFVTGCRSIPLDGLDPSFTIALSMDTAEDTSREDNSKIGILPRAHTCFNQLVLPPYTSSSQLAEQIQLAISFGSEGFFMH